MTLAYRGVIEGFYGRPWTPPQRHELLERLAAWGMNVFVYGPKDDLRVRAAWRSRYEEAEARELARLAEAADRHGVELHYAIAPGLDIAYANAADRRALREKVDQVLDLGARGVTLLFDDIPSGLSARDAEAFDSFGHAHADVANELHAHLRTRGDVPLLLCPTEYCDRFAMPSVEESPYLHALGAHLAPGIDVYWTGPEIVSETVPVEALARFARVVARAPVLWDNLHANDYDGRRLYLGPYAGRSPEVRARLRGVIANPNVEYEANAVPLHTTAAWTRGEADGAEAEAHALEAAIDAWLPRFATHDGAMAREELRLLIDYLHLPFRHGPQAEEHLRAARRLARAARARAPAQAPPRESPPPRSGDDRAFLADRARRLRELHQRITELRDRDLAYALYPYTWDLKEEGEVWARFAARDGAGFCRPEALPNTYRTGILDDLQALLPLDADGCARP